jgi:hypothetical protein
LWEALLTALQASPEDVSEMVCKTLGQLAAVHPVPDSVWETLVAIAAGQSHVAKHTRNIVREALKELSAVLPVPNFVWAILTQYATFRKPWATLTNYTSETLLAFSQQPEDDPWRILQAVLTLGALSTVRTVPDSVWEALVAVAGHLDTF